jgi:APA family basic amino acid/polyamine antiporter
MGGIFSHFERRGCMPNQKGKKIQEDGTRLVRQLGLFDSTMVMMGIVIGSGIFLTTGIMAKAIPSTGLLLLAWIVGGLLTLAGALTYAELGAALPHAGGQYVYLKEAYGKLVAFLFGWIVFLVYMTGGIAGLAVAFSEYLGIFFPFLSTDRILFSLDLGIFRYSLSMGQLVGVGAILLLSALNYIGLVFGKIVQNLFTVVKIGTLTLFIIFGLALGNGSAFPISFRPAGSEMGLGGVIVGFGVALVLVSWAFDGWNNVNFVAGEIRNPKRNLPRALILGTLGITILYMLMNVVYLYALPITEIQGIERIAERSASVLFGGSAAVLVTVGVLISVFGALNGSILAGPRVYYAMAKDDLFFSRVSQVHPRFKTPAFAILIQAIWASVLALSGTFEQIITFVMFVSIIFWIAGTASVFTLRKKQPDLPRPYKTWGYPIMPIVFIVASTGILINTLFEKPVESLAGLGITVLGIPVYYYWKNRGQKSEFRDQGKR